MRGVISSLCRSQVVVALGLLAGIYLIAVSFFPSADTNAEQWRHDHFYGAYFVDDRRLQSIDEAPVTASSLGDGNEDKKARVLPTGRRRTLDRMRNRSKIISTTNYEQSRKAVNTAISDTIFLRTAVVYTQAKGGVAVRITSLQECGNKRTTKLRIGDLEISLQKNTIYNKCPWPFTPKCTLVGYYATGVITSRDEQEVPLPPRLPPFAEVYDSRKEVWKPIELIDGRSTPTHAHRLAVCLQPMYLMADWPLIANFFETWIGHGATIFYIYVHSVSEEVDLMIRLYEAQQDIEVVRVNWAAVPTNKSDADDHNPNNRMYRTEVGTAVNDCILRARATADLAVSSDLDEIIAPMNQEEKLLDIIEEYSHCATSCFHFDATGHSSFTRCIGAAVATSFLSQTISLSTDRQFKATRKLKRPGAFLFQQSFAYAENNWFSVSHPSQITFDHYKSVDYEIKAWESGFRSKVIYVPDRVFRAHVHDVVGFETDQWERAFIEPNRARVLHFRQIKNKWMVRENVTSGSDLLANAAAGWQKTLAARLEAAMKADTEVPVLRGAFNLTFTTPEWPNLGEQVLSEIEACRIKNEEIKKVKCVTEWTCRSTMEALRPGQWVEPEPDSSWVVI